MADKDLSRRERQILDSLYARGRATVGEILEDLPDPPTDSALRAMLRILERKKRVRRQFDGRRLIYTPAIPQERAGRTALQHLMRTFFSGSRELTVRAILSEADADLTDAELERLARLVDDARRSRR